MIEHIKRLKASYFRTLDEKLWDDFGQLFTPDCEFITYADLLCVGPKRRYGREAIVASVRRKTRFAVTIHQGELLEFEIQSPDCATAVWQMTDYAELTDGTSLRILRGSGRYYERYRLMDDNWLIARLELKRLGLVVE